MQLQSPFEAYQLYIAIKNHFHTNYDFFKYRGKIKVQHSAFEVRKDKYFFSKLQKHSNPIGLLVSNFIDNPNAWIGDIVNAEVSEDIYLRWKKRQDAITHTYQEDLKKLDTDIDMSLAVRDGQHPTLLKHLIGNTIYPETVLILNCHLNFFSYWASEIIDPAIWPNEHMRLAKYRQFVKFDKDKTKKITVDYFQL